MIAFSGFGLLTSFRGENTDDAVSAPAQGKDQQSEETVKTDTSINHAEKAARELIFSDVYDKSENGDRNESAESGIDYIYDAMPRSENTSNFKSLKTGIFHNINGEDVSVDVFVRQPNEALNNPNVGQGIMLYQGIQYKLAHPEKDVAITIASFHFSVVASVNVQPDSRWYGYMRSLYETDYDEFGFVRISYLLVVAAKLGIEVTAIGQIDGAAVKQISGTRDDISFVSYFNSHLDDDCYDLDYLPEGSKVSDYMTFREAKWTSYGDRAGSDMMHVKVCTVSDYIDQDGVERKYATWMGSTNLDGIHLDGSNGNDGAQTGMIVSNHEAVHRTVYNFMRKMSTLCEKEDIYEFRDYVNRTNKEQINMLLAGESVPEDEQIVYIGTDQDKVFEVYFTPFGGSVGEWDARYDPYVKYVPKLLDSTGYIEFYWNNANHNIGFNLSNTINLIVYEAFAKNPNLKNKIYTHLAEFNTSLFDGLEIGKDLGAKDLNSNMSFYIHSKDMQLSYEENYERHYVTIFATPNFHLGGLSYQANVLIVVNETYETGNTIYKTLAKHTTSGIY